MNNNLSNTPIPAIGRLLLAAIFLLSGLGKVMAPTASIGYISAMGLPFPTLAYAAAVAVEIGGGALLVLGFQARLVSVVLAIFTLVTAVAFHRNFADQNQMIHFMKNLAMIGGLLQVIAFGAGNFSLDARRSTH